MTRLCGSCHSVPGWRWDWAVPSSPFEAQVTQQGLQVKEFQENIGKGFSHQKKKKVTLYQGEVLAWRTTRCFCCIPGMQLWGICVFDREEKKNSGFKWGGLESRSTLGAPTPRGTKPWQLLQHQSRALRRFFSLSIIPWCCSPLRRGRFSLAGGYKVCTGPVSMSAALSLTHGNVSHFTPCCQFLYLLFGHNPLGRCLSLPHLPSALPEQ